MTYSIPSAPEPWMDSGNCIDVNPELFFPSPGIRPLEALAICASCHVKTKCLAYALQHQEQGVWGGTTEQQRARMRQAAS